MNLVPLPGAYAMYGMTAGRVVGVAQRLGMFGSCSKARPRPVASPRSWSCR